METAMNPWQWSQLKRQWTHGKETNWNGNEPMSKISGWHGNTEHVINSVREDRTIGARSKTSPSQAGATDSHWERNIIAEVVTCTCIHIEIVLKSTTNSNNRDMSAQQCRRSWACNGTMKMMSTQRYNKDDEHAKAQQRWWARKGATTMSAWWCINEDDDMHATAPMMTCARQQGLMIARQRKMKISTQPCNDKDWRAMAQTWRSVCDGPKMNNNKLSERPWQCNFKQSAQPKGCDNELESATLMAQHYRLARDLGSMTINWVHNLSSATSNRDGAIMNLRMQPWKPEDKP